MKHTNVEWAPLALFFTLASYALASTTPGITRTSDRFAWFENAGWSNWRDTVGGVSSVRISTGEDFLSGYSWCENIGWMNLGDGAGPYANMDGSSSGVNILVSGYLDGFGWLENAGWINFGTQPFVGAAGAYYDSTTNEISGYAWSENIGWLLIGDSNTTIGFEFCPEDLDKDSVVDSSDLSILISQWGQPGPTDLNGDGTTDSTDLASLTAAWGNCY